MSKAVFCEYIEGEAHIKGFLLAYLGMYRYYQLYPEYELNKGFADFLFKPSPSVPVMPPLTYLLEVKYAKAGASEKEIRHLPMRRGSSYFVTARMNW